MEIIRIFIFQLSFHYYYWKNDWKLIWKSIITLVKINSVQNLEANNCVASFFRWKRKKLHNFVIFILGNEDKNGVFVVNPPKKLYLCIIQNYFGVQIKTYYLKTRLSSDNLFYIFFFSFNNPKFSEVRKKKHLRYMKLNSYRLMINDTRWNCLFRNIALQQKSIITLDLRGYSNAT